MVTLPAPLDGASDRRDRRADRRRRGGSTAGSTLLAAHQAQRMLISGVAPGVRPARAGGDEHRAGRRCSRCCVDLGHEAVDTRSNADETAAWVRDARLSSSVRLVTSDWHLARAELELARALGGDVTIDRRRRAERAARWALLIAEYNKLLLRRVALWPGIGA